MKGIQVLIEKEEGIQLAKEHKAKYLTLEFEKVSCIFWNTLKYEGKHYSLKKVKQYDGSIGEYFIRMDKLTHFRNVIMPDLVGEIRHYDFSK